MRRSVSGGRLMNEQSRSLSYDEAQILHEKVLPAARKWLRQFPHLADHAVTTLQFWGEPLVDDNGRPFFPERARRQAQNSAPKRFGGVA